ncbi:MAG: alpha/beta hydrolase-fold protein [Bacteroidota bacterium]
MRYSICRILCVTLLALILPFLLPANIYGQSPTQADGNPGGAWKLSAFIDFKSSDTTATDSAERITEFVNAQKGTPIIRGQEVLFLFQSPPNSSPQINGDFNEWAALDGPFAGSGFMSPIGNSGWFAHKIQALPNSRSLYKINLGNRSIPDPLNTQRVFSFGSQYSELVLEGARTSPVDPKTKQALLGRMDTLSFYSKIRDKKRKIYKYKPPASIQQDPVLPLLFILDGESWLKFTRLDLIIERMILDRRLKPFTAVFVPPIQRGLEYGGWRKFREMMYKELIPFIDSLDQVNRHPEDRGLLGASRGGLAALDLLFKDRGYFTFVGAIAPAIEPLPFLQELMKIEAPNTDIELSIMNCQYDLQKLQKQAHQLKDILREKAFSLEFLEFPVSHTYEGWRHYVDEVIISWNMLKPKE